MSQIATPAPRRLATQDAGPRADDAQNPALSSQPRHSEVAAGSGTVAATRRMSRWVRRVIVAVAGVAVVGFSSATPALAAGGGYNTSLTSSWTWGDCQVNVGVVRDVYTPWAAIGGSNTSCRQRHSSTSVSVVLLFNGSVVSGSTGSAYYTNSLGTGSHIVETGRFCGAGNWAERATITVSGLGTYTFTTPASYVKTQCG